MRSVSYEGPLFLWLFTVKLFTEKLKKILWIPTYSPLRASFVNILQQLLSHIYTDFTYFFSFHSAESHLKVNCRHFATSLLITCVHLRWAFFFMNSKDVSIKFIIYLIWLWDQICFPLIIPVSVIHKDSSESVKKDILFEKM